MRIEGHDRIMGDPEIPETLKRRLLSRYVRSRQEERIQQQLSRLGYKLTHRRNGRYRLLWEHTMTSTRSRVGSRRRCHMNRHDRRKAAKVASLRRSHSVRRAVEAHAASVTIPDDLKADIARSVRSSHSAGVMVERASSARRLVWFSCSISPFPRRSLSAGWYI